MLLVRWKKSAVPVVGILSTLLGLPSLAPGQTPPAVWTQHNDNLRSGDNLSETQLTPGNVNSSSFGRLFSYMLDDQTYSQPLYVPGLKMAVDGQSHNVVFVTTVNNSVYAFDADNPNANGGYPLWHVNLTPSGARPPVNSDLAAIGACGGDYVDIAGQMGIIGTPVIDTSLNEMFLVSRTVENGGYVQRLHALNIMSGVDVPGSPVVIQASYQGISFDPKLQNQRPALALNNGSIYICWSSHCDTGNYHGWVMSYLESSLTQTGAWTTTTTAGGEAGIWQAGQAPVIDSSGDLYLQTGNGAWDGVSNFGDSAVKLSTSGGISLVDYFTPNNYAYLGATDGDLGSGGILGIPGTSMLIGGGKQGMVYLLNMNNMGHENQTDNVLQEFQVTFPIDGATGHLHSGPVYFNSGSTQYLYFWGEDDYLRAFTFNGSTVNSTPVATSAMRSPVLNTGMPGGFMSLSANGTSNGILWAITPYDANANHAVVHGIVHAFSAVPSGANLTELWNSLQNPTQDDVGYYSKYTYPTVSNGKLYVDSWGQTDYGKGQLWVYGLLTGSSSIPSANGVSASPGNNELALSWNPVPNATSYNVYRSTVAGGEGPTPVAAGISIPYYTDTGLINGTTYYYTVGAVASTGTSLQSTEISAVPSAPAEVPYNGAAWSIPGTIYFDNYDRGGQGVAYNDTDATNDGGEYRQAEGVDIEACSDIVIGNYFDVTDTEPGEWMRYTVDPATTSSYTVTLRVASVSGGSMHLQDQYGNNLSGPISIPATGGEQNWTSISTTVSLNSGEQVIEVYEDTGSYSLSFMNFGYASQVAVTGSPNPNGVGQTVVLSATVTGSGPAPTGTVEFYDGTTPLGVGGVVSGVARTSVVFGLSGTQTITAQYSGDSYYAPSSAVWLQTSEPTLADQADIADSYVQLGEPTTNYGTLTKLLVKNAGSATRWTYLRFDLIPFQSSVISATLELYGNSGNSTPDSISVYGVTNDTWTETGIDWDNAPAPSAPALSTTLVGSTFQYYNWDVTSFVNSQIAAGAAAVNLAVEMNAVPVGGEPDTFNSKEAGANTPQLVIGYNAPPTVAQAAAANPNPVYGLTTNLSVLGADNAGEVNLTYTWSSTGPAPVTFALNGSNAAQNTTATFAQPGLYNISATIADMAGLTVTSTVAVHVVPQLSVIELTSVADSYVQAGTPTTNYGLDPIMLVKNGNGGSTNRISYLTFNLGSVSGIVNGATLNLYGSTVSGTDIDSAYPVSNTTWSENNIDYANMPSYGPTALSDAQIGPKAQYYTWDVSTYTSAQFAGGNNAVSFAVVMDNLPSSNSADTFNTKEAVADHPQLEVYYDAPPTISVSASANPNPVVSGNTTTLSVLGTSDYGQTVLTYTWSVSSGPAAVSFSPNGTNAAQTCTATFTQFGTYTLTATVTDPQGLSATSNVSVSVTPSTTTLALAPTADTYVQSGTPTTNYGTAATLLVKNGLGGSTTRYSFLTFNLSSISGIVQNAQLKLYGNTTNSTPDSLSVMSVANTSWTQTGIDWANMPAYSPSPISSASIGSTSQYYVWPVESYVGPQFASGNDLVSFAVVMDDSPSSSKADSFNSTQAGSNLPQLVVNYTPAPSVAASAAANPNPVIGATSSTALSVLGADSIGEQYLTYTWSSTGPAPVTFSANGTNASCNTTATFSQAGSYTLSAAIQDPFGQTVSSSVSINVVASISTAQLAPAADTYVQSGAPTTNYGSSTSLLVKNGLGGSTTRYTYLTFNLSGLPAEQIDSATLRLYGNSGNSTSDTLSLHSVADTLWTQTGLDWSNMPPFSSTALSTASVSSTLQYYTWDLSGYVEAQFAAGSPVISLALQMNDAPSSSNPDGFHSSWAADPPQLVVTYN